MMKDARVMSMEKLQFCLNSSDSLKFNGHSRTETYAWIEKTLRQYKYLACPRAEKGLLRQYLQKMTGLSPAQLTRLIDQFRRTRQVRLHPYQRHRFPTKFTLDDQLLLAEVDNAHERLSGPATQVILKREYELFGHQEFERLRTISVSHLYRLRFTVGRPRSFLRVRLIHLLEGHLKERKSIAGNASSWALRSAFCAGAWGSVRKGLRFDSTGGEGV